MEEKLRVKEEDAEETIENTEEFIKEIKRVLGRS